MTVLCLYKWKQGEHLMVLCDNSNLDHDLHHDVGTIADTTSLSLHMFGKAFVRNQDHKEEQIQKRTKFQLSDL